MDTAALWLQQSAGRTFWDHPHNLSPEAVFMRGHTWSSSGPMNVRWSGRRREAIPKDFQSKFSENDVYIYYTTPR